MDLPCRNLGNGLSKCSAHVQGVNFDFAATTMEYYNAAVYKTVDGYIFIILVLSYRIKQSSPADAN